MQHQSPEAQHSGRSTIKWTLGLFAGCFLLLTCMACMVIAGATGILVYADQLASGSNTPAMNGSERAISESPASPTPSPIPATPTLAVPESASPSSPSPPPSITAALTPTLVDVTPEAKPFLDLNPPSQIGQAAIMPEMITSLDNLMRAEYPAHEFYESAARLGSFDLGDRTVASTPHEMWAVEEFFVEEETINATLSAMTAHTYFWVEEGLDLDPVALQEAADRFENDYYPQIVELIGPEWNPGVDGDPHFSVLHLSGRTVTTDELGYFNSGDEYPTSFYFDSNQQEILYLNMGNLTLGEDLYYGTLVHEYQHLAHWYLDANETTWMDEGLAQLTELYVGLETAGFTDYLVAPETQLNAWSYDDDVYAHYSAAYLFMVYLWEQLGDGAIQALARHPGNGLAAVSAVLAEFRPDTSLDQLVADWAVANLLDDPADGVQYNYSRLNLSGVHMERTIRALPQETVTSLNPFGVHYIDLPLSGETTISFAGDTTTELVPVSPYKGDFMWHVPAVDALDAHLTRSFDLSGLDQATLTFWTWYDLERDYDFAYLSVSLDNGQTWDLLAPDQARPGDYGPAFTGESRLDQDASDDGWLPVSASLNSYVGRTILVRFELLTDSAVVEQGFAVDEIAIPELGYASGVESGADGWEASGFVRTGRWLPQRWSVQLVATDANPRVMTLTVDELNQGQWTVVLGRRGGTLIIIPTTPFATDAANYWLSIE